MGVKNFLKSKTAALLLPIVISEAMKLMKEQIKTFWGNLRQSSESKLEEAIDEAMGDEEYATMEEVKEWFDAVEALWTSNPMLRIVTATTALFSK